MNHVVQLCHPSCLAQLAQGGGSDLRNAAEPADWRTQGSRLGAGAKALMQKRIEIASSRLDLAGERGSDLPGVSGREARWGYCPGDETTGGVAAAQVVPLREVGTTGTRS